MKLSHLSLAILSAIALAACGGSGSDDHTTDPNANKPGATDQTPKQPEDKKDEDKKEDTAKEDDKIVNPTDEQVVDNINLAETSTTASQQYIRGEKSSFDRTANPSEPASATVLSGISLDIQNPQLTNIVIGRAEGKNNKGELVQIAQYAGSYDKNMASVGGQGDSLQKLNKPNALVQTINRSYYDSINYTAKSGTDPASAKLQGGFITTQEGTFVNPSILNAMTIGKFSGVEKPYVEVFENYVEKLSAYNQALKDYEAAPSADSTVANSTAKALKDAAEALVSFDPAKSGQLLAGSTKPLNVISVANYSKLLQELKLSSKDEPVKVVKVSSIDKAAGDPSKLEYFNPKVKLPNLDKLADYGYGNYIFTLNNTTIAGNGEGGLIQGGWGDVYNPVTKKVEGVSANNSSSPTFGGDQKGPTHGLVGIWKQGDKFHARGTDDNNVRTTRIFGHYYLDPGAKDGVLLPELSNSWVHPNVIITGVDDKTKKPKTYGLAVEPVTLSHVQYGRVTAELDKINLGKEGKTTGWDFRHQSVAERDPEHKSAADDFYFYRGTDATTIDEMGKLPTDVKIGYQGHALMYGLDNSFHGSGRNLPNAFGTAQNYGLGNFVEAELDMGKKELTGTIYNAWHNQEQNDFYKDVLVDFSGNVVGNTAYGEATRRYVDNDTPGTFKGSFYGARAEELGGAINSVTDKEVYGKIGWGGVFGAHRTSTGGNAWLVSSEKK